MAETKTKDNNSVRTRVHGSVEARGWTERQRQIGEASGQRSQRSARAQPELTMYANALRDPVVLCANLKIK